MNNVVRWATSRRPDREFGDVAPDRRLGAIGRSFVLFTVAVLGLAALAAGGVDRSFDLQSSLAPQLGAVAATVYALAGLLAAYRFVRSGRRTMAFIAGVMDGPGAIWCWVVFVQSDRPSSLSTGAVGLASAVLAVTLLARGLRFAHWLETFSGLGALALLLVTAVDGLAGAGTDDSPVAALLAAVGGMAALYGSLVDLELSEQRSMIELIESRRHIEQEMARAEEILHDLRTGLLAIEAAIGTFDGELAEPVRSEAARLRRLTVGGRRTMGSFDLVGDVRNLVATRRASGTEVDLRAPGSATVWGEESEILAIVDNLLSNAERHGRSTPITVEIDTDQGRTRLSVTNGGAPIADPERIFERGFSSHPDGQGIGLSRARMLAAMNSGRLEVRSCDTGSTTFTLELASRPTAVA